MFINLNSDGTIAKVIGTRVFRKSNSVSTIALFAPFAKDASIKINYVLPDGSVFSDIMLYQEFSQVEEKNLFTCKVTHSITEIEGRVTVSLEIHATNDDQVEIQTTAETYITVEASTSNDLILPQEDVFLNAVNSVNAQVQMNKEDIANLTGSDTTFTEYMANTDQTIDDLQQADQNHDTRLQNKIKSVSVDNTTDIPKIHYENETQAFNIDIKGFVMDANYNASTGLVTLITSGDDIPDITFDLPTELRFESGRYDEATKDLIMVLANGSEIAIPVDDIFKPISDLETRATNIETKNTAQDNRLTTIEGVYLKKDGTVKMDEGYQPTTPEGIANKDYVDKTIQGVTGQDMSNIVTPSQLNEAIDNVKAELDDPTFIEEIFDKAVNTPAHEIYNAPQELVSIQGKTLPILTAEEQAIADLKIDDSLKNIVINPLTCPQLNEKVRKINLWECTTIHNEVDESSPITYMFTIKYITSDYNITKNPISLIETFPYNNDYYLDERLFGFVYSNSNMPIRVEKTIIDNIVTEQGITKIQALLYYLEQENIHGFFELAIKNPNEHTVIDTEITLYKDLAEIDLIQFPKPYDSLTLADTSLTGIAALEGYEECASISADNVGKFNIKGVVNKVSVIVAKDSYDITSAKALLKDLKFTYQLAQPRILQTTFESVENPTEKIVGKNLLSVNSVNDNNMSWVTLEQDIILTPNIPYTFQHDLSSFVGVDLQLVQFNDDLELMQYVSILSVNSKSFVPLSDDYKWILRIKGDGDIVAKDIMLNEGDTALPYEVYQEQKKSFVTTLHEFDSITKDDKKLNNSFKYDLALYENITSGALDNVYYFTFEYFVETYGIDATVYNLITKIPYQSSISAAMILSYPVWRWAGTVTTVIIYFPKFLIDKQSGVTLIDKCKSYLQAENPQGLFKKITITEEPLVPTVSWLGDNPVFDKNSTIYQESDTPVLPINTFKCPLDTAGQVKALFDSRQELLEEVEGLKDGTIKAGDSNKLNGNDVNYFATAQDIGNIQDGTTPVGHANDSDKLGGQLPNHYATQDDLQGIDGTVQVNEETIADIVDGTTPVGDSDKLGGQLPSFYDNSGDVSDNTTAITERQKLEKIIYYNKDSHKDLNAVWDYNIGHDVGSNSVSYKIRWSQHSTGHSYKETEVSFNGNTFAVPISEYNVGTIDKAIVYFTVRVNDTGDGLYFTTPKRVKFDDTEVSITIYIKAIYECVSKEYYIDGGEV